MNKEHFFRNSKYILLSVIVLSIATFGVIETVDAVHKDFSSPTDGLNPDSKVTVNVVAGDNPLAFRDSSNDNPQTATVSIDTSTSGQGFVTITVEEEDSNLDFNSADIILASATSTTSGLAETKVTLVETGDNTGVFSGQLPISSSGGAGVLQVSSVDQINATYVEQHSGIERFSANLKGLIGSGTVEIFDYTVVDFDGTFTRADAACPFRLVTHPVEIQILPSTIEVPTSAITVTISYANAVLTKPGGGEYTPQELSMLWRFGILAGIGGFNVFNGAPVVDTGAKTITATLDNFVHAATLSGQYALGVNVSGCTGGGGGGLVRQGLVVNALGGISAAISGGGGGGPPGPTLTLGALALYDKAVEIISMPQEIRDIALNYDPYTPLELIIDTYEDFDLPFSINGNGFALGGYENTIETQTIGPSEPTEFVLVYYTNSELAHSSLNFNLGPTRTIAGSDTQVLLYKDKPPEIVDPNGNIASFTGSINNEGDLKRVATFLVTFSESAELPNPDIVIRSWSDNLSSGDTIIYDAIEIAQPEIVEIADEDIPEPEIQTLKSQYVPIWIKNNAAWWSQQLIEDSDFVAGIEYLIQNEIITIQDNQVITSSYSSNEIPEWIKNNAGWWSEDLITEKEFIDGLQWLISNGIIQVTET